MKVHVLHRAIVDFGSIRRQQAHGGNFAADGTGVDAPPLRSSGLGFFTSFFSGRLLSSALTNEMTPYFR